MLIDQCKLIHAAVWHENGTISYEGDQAWGFKIDYEKTRNTNEGVTAAKTLDTIFKEFGLDKVDYIKMDIDGAEKFVLESAENWTYRVTMLKIELALLIICIMVRAILTHRDGFMGTGNDAISFRSVHRI